MAELRTSSQYLPFRLQPRPWGRLRERARTSAMSDDVSRRVRPFVAATVILSAAAILWVQSNTPDLSSGAYLVALILVLLGLGAEMMSFNQSKDTAGSAGYIPFAAAVLVAPGSNTILAVIVAEIVVQVSHKRQLIKATFNIAQHALGLALGISAVLLLTDGNFRGLHANGFVESVREYLLPTTLILGVVQFVNNLFISAIVTLSARRRFLPQWFLQTRQGTLHVFVNVVVTFYVAWLSVNLGLWGTAGMALPILLVRQLHRTTVELTTVTEELLELMVAAIEARDAYTSGHSRRVARASEIIAKALGLSAAETERVSVAALLHDVGKIDERFGPILAKEGRLTTEEWEIMKRHPIRGAELVGLLSSLRDIVAPVRHHHENWDGTGYPDGLRGEAIPLASRIIMFADTLDAITTDRPYRKALGIEEARAEFVRFRGKQFDPAICDIVVSREVWAELYLCFAGDGRRAKLAAS